MTSESATRRAAEFLDGYYATRTRHPADGSPEEQHAIHVLAAYIEATPPQGEAVAWVWEDDIGDRHSTTDKDVAEYLRTGGVAVSDCYTAPPPVMPEGVREDERNIARLEAALKAAIDADRILARATKAEGDLDKMVEWAAENHGTVVGRDEIASTIIVNLQKHIDREAALTPPAGGEG